MRVTLGQRTGARLAALALFVFALIGVTTWGLAQATTLKIMTYNIHHGERLDGVIDLAGQAQFMLETGADIIGLQEVDVGTARTARVDQAAFQARSIGFNHVFTSHFPHQGGEYGLALLSRYPIVAHESYALPTEPGSEPKSLLKATIDVDGVLVDMYVIHFEVRNVPLRHEQALAAAEIVKRGKHPAVIMGDFNDQAYSQVSVPFRHDMIDTHAAARMLAPARHMEDDAVSERTYAGGGATYPVIDPRVRADAFWHTPEWMPIGPVEAPASTYSDHRPAIVTLQLVSDSRSAASLVTTWDAADRVNVFVPSDAAQWLAQANVDPKRVSDVLAAWLADLDMQVELVTDVDDIVPGSLVILPGGRFLSQTEVTALRQHVDAGGGLIAWGDAGLESTKDDNGPAEFESLLGIRYLGWSYGYPTRDVIVLNSDVADWPDAMAESFTFWLYEGPLVQPLEGATVLAEWRQSDGVSSSHRTEMNAALVQNGRTLYLATTPLNLGDRNNPVMRSFVTGLVQYLSTAQSMEVQ